MGTAVLLSGGLDSAVLLAEEAARGDVQPVYVSVGLAWEALERDAIVALLAHEAFRGAGPLVTLTVDMRDVYPATHWAVQGRLPAYHTPDQDVYLPGRNIILLGKAGVYCAALELTLSCMKPRVELPAWGPAPVPQHCGGCSKCRERHDAFIDARIPDPTRYADTTNIT